MKAYVLHDIDNLIYEDVKKPELKNGEVLIKVRAAGICGSDIPRIYKNGTYTFPLIPGHEFSGVVEDVANFENDQWLNKRVGIFPLLPCHECDPCKNNNYELCRHYSYLGSRCNGAFAEYVSCPVENLIEIPDAVTFEEAAMLEPLSVAVHAIRNIAPQKDDTVLVCGLGTIGLFIVMMLKQMKIKNILVVGNKEFQKQKALSLGITAEDYCDSNNANVEEWINLKTFNNGVNVFFECVGKNETISLALKTTKPNGKVQLVGNPYSDMCFDKNTYWNMLRNQLTVKGTWNSSFLHSENDDWHYVLNLLSENRIAPAELITHKFAFDSLKSGLEIMRDKKEEYVKIMITDNK